MRKPPLVPTLISFMAIVILLKLGFWQLARAQEKLEIIELKAAKGDVVFNSLQDALEDGGSHDFKQVKVTGQVISQRLMYWDNRVLDGKVGYEILVPVKTDAGVLMVNFGWLADTDFRRSFPQVDLPAVISQNDVILYLPQYNQLTRQTQSLQQWPMLLQQPDMAVITEALNMPVLPILGYIVNAEDFGLTNNFKPVTMPPEKHIAYAMQWFLLALACLVIYGFALRKKWKDERTK